MRTLLGRMSVSHGGDPSEFDAMPVRMSEVPGYDDTDELSHAMAMQQLIDSGRLSDDPALVQSEDADESEEAVEGEVLAGMVAAYQRRRQLSPEQILGIAGQSRWGILSRRGLAAIRAALMFPSETLVGSDEDPANTTLVGLDAIEAVCGAVLGAAAGRAVHYLEADTDYDDEL